MNRIVVIIGFIGALGFFYGAYVELSDFRDFQSEGIDARAKIISVNESIGGKCTDKKYYIDVMFFTNDTRVSSIGSNISSSVTLFGCDNSKYYDSSYINIVYLKNNPKVIDYRQYSTSLVVFYGLLFFGLLLLGLSVLLIVKNKH